MKIMKKILLTLVAIFSVGVFAALADNDKVINKNQLPAQAQSFLKAHFDGVELTYAKLERDVFERSYEVMLANGSKIEFSSKGNWEEIDCRYGEVPAAIVPEPIKEFVAKNYAGEKIVAIERHRNEIEVRLSNRLELTFDKNLNIIDIDD